MVSAHASVGEYAAVRGYAASCAPGSPLAFEIACHLRTDINSTGRWFGTQTRAALARAVICQNKHDNQGASHV